MHNNLLNTQQLGYWALIVCIVAETTMAHFRIGPMPLRVYILVVFFFIGSISALYDQKPIRIEFPLKILIVYITLSALLQGVDILNDRYWYFLLRGMGASVLIFMLTMVVLRKQYKKLDTILTIYISIVTISAFVCLMQAFNIDIFWKLRDWTSADLENEIELAINDRYRPVGLALNSVEIAYQICIVFPLALYMMAKTKGQRKLIYIGLITILTLGAVASQTRSALLGIIIAYGFFSYSTSTSRNSRLWRLGMPITVTFILVFLSVIVGLSERLIKLDDSAQGKIFLVYMGLLYMQSNPLGSGILMTDFFRFKEEAIGLFLDYGDAVSSQVERYTPHNQFINTGVMFGWIGFLLLFYFYWKLWIGLGKLQGIKGNGHLPVALQASLGGYIVNSLFHNAGPFVGDPMAWYVIGIASAVIARNKIQ